MLRAVLTAADDGFHLEATDDRSWTETAWFAAAVPERGLCMWTYPLFRHELGIMSCGIYVWEPGAEELWQLPYYRTWWHLPIPRDAELSDLRLPNGLSYQCLEPLTAYRISYEDGSAISLDMTFRALHPPHEVGVEPGGHGHIDQLGRVTGELRLGEERIEINCVEMRDRTWSPRRESRQRAFVSYSYGAEETGSGARGFHLSTRWRPDRGLHETLTGFLLRDGAVAPLLDGTCEIDRDDLGQPVSVVVRGQSQDGNVFHARGEVVSRIAIPSTPWFVWACVVRWTLQDGAVVYGEHQDTWAPALLRDHLGRGRPSSN
jgi:hypothetical protein